MKTFHPVWMVIQLLFGRWSHITQKNKSTWPVTPLKWHISICVKHLFLAPVLVRERCKMWGDKGVGLKQTTFIQSLQGSVVHLPYHAAVDTCITCSMFPPLDLNHPSVTLITLFLTDGKKEMYIKTEILIKLQRSSIGNSRLLLKYFY